MRDPMRRLLCWGAALLMVLMAAAIRDLPGRRSPPSAMTVDDYDFRVDEQALELAKLRQQLVYYLSGLATALMVFVATLAIQDKTELAKQRVPAVAVGLLGFLAVAFSVRAIIKQNRSFQLHLRYRTSRQTFEQLRETEQKAWSRLNVAARRGVFAALVAIAGQVGAIGVLLWTLVE